MTRRPDESVVHGSKARPQALPSLERLLQGPALAALRAEHGHTLLAGVARGLVDELRARAVAGELSAQDLTPAVLDAEVSRRVAHRLTPNMRAVFNLTGTVLHTNLGRALLADAALQQVMQAMAGPNNLEFDLVSGKRGERDSLVEGLLCELTGAPAATVVNNNAAAVLLTLTALARGKQVIVSRGELVEIGGAFRLPEVMAAAGAKLVEVGTTNRTHLRDYEQAITPRTAALLKVHTSNYAVQGFTAAVDEAQLASLARAHGLPLITDLGSGALIDLAAYGLPAEPLPQRMLAEGCAVVTFSGDKLLGGPQAGLIVGSHAAITRIRNHPLKRALRISKLPLAALEATLRLYLRPERLGQDLPTLRHLIRPLEAVQRRASELQPELANALAPHFAVGTLELFSQIGSGSLPVERLPSAGLALAPLARRGVGRALEQLASALRALPRPVIGRVAEDRLLLDLRCLDDADVAPFLAQLPLLREALA